MHAAQVDRDLAVPSNDVRPAAVVASPLLAPAFPRERDFERVDVDDSASVSAIPELHDCGVTLSNEFDAPTVTIIMATYQGERFLNEQLDSIAAQTHRYWRLFV